MRNDGAPSQSYFIVDFESPTGNPLPKFPETGWFYNGCTANRVVNTPKGEQGISSLFPNPTDDKLTYSNPFYEEESIEIRIFDLAGRLVQQRKIEQPDSRIDIQLEGIPAGTYLFQAISSEDSFVKKFVKR